MKMHADGRFGMAATVKAPCSLIEQGAELGSMAGADCGGKLLLEGVNGAASAARADRSLSGGYCEWAASPAHNQRVHSRARHIRPSKYADFFARPGQRAYNHTMCIKRKDTKACGVHTVGLEAR